MQFPQSLIVLFIVACARAQLQHNSVHLQEDKADPRRNQLSGPLYPAVNDRTPRFAGSGDNALPASRSAQVLNQVSRYSRLNGISSLRSSIQHVLRATSAEETRQQHNVDTTSGSGQKDTSAHTAVLPSRQVLGWPEDHGRYFSQNMLQARSGVAGDTPESMSNPAQVQSVLEHGDSSNTNNISSDQGSVTLSSLLEDAFLERNPATPPTHFMGDSHADSALDSDNDESISVHQAGNTQVMKRAQESMPKDGASPETSQQYADNATNLSVQERSWRCSIPDVLVGDGDLPWTCHQRWAWRFLGEHVYPSRVYEAVCEGRTCWYGHFNCTPITYTLHVLELCLHGCHDQRVPYALRSFWQWTDLNVTVGCQCVR